MRHRLADIARLTAVLALFTIAWAATGTLPILPALAPAGDRATPALAAPASGPLVVKDRDGRAILAARSLAPGQTTAGEVTVSNAGDARGTFTLSVTALADTATGALDVAVLDITSTRPLTVFTGELRRLGRASLGTFAPGAKRRYRFELTYPPSTRAVGGHHESASASVAFDWDATADTGRPARPSRVRAASRRQRTHAWSARKPSSALYW